MAFYGCIAQDAREEDDSWRKVTEELFKLLENIEYLSNNSDDPGQAFDRLKKHSARWSKKRFNYVDTDGHDLFLPGEKPKLKKERPSRFKLKTGHTV